MKRYLDRVAGLMIGLVFAASVSMAGNFTYLKGPTLIESHVSLYANAGSSQLTKDTNTNVLVTGTLSHTVVLPNATTIPDGRRFRIKNQSSANVALDLYTGTDAKTLFPGSTIEALLIAAGTADGIWWVDEPLSLYVDTGGIVFGNSTSNGIDFDDSNFYWNNTSKRLGIGTSAPQASLHVTGAVRSGSLAAGGAVVADTDGDLSVEDPLTIGNGGTNSTAALSSNRVMISSSGSIVENSALTPGYVVFPNSSGLPAGSANLYWSSALSRLGVGTSSPQTNLHVQGEIRSTTLAPGGVVVADSDGDLSAQTTLSVANGGTNSASALNNNRLMISSGGSIVENSALTQGRLVYPNSSGLPAGSSTLFWDNVNVYLGVGTGVPTETLDVYGGHAFRYSNSTLTGNIDALTSANISGVRFTGASAVTLRGIAHGVDGKEVTLSNVSGNDLTISNQHATPTTTNRIITGTGSDLTLADGASVLAKYDGTTSRWRIIGGSGSGSGGSGATIDIEWMELADSPHPGDADSGTTRQTTWGGVIYEFEAGLGQQLKTVIKVPSTYSTGSPITLRVLFINEDGAGNVLFQTTSTLIRTATDTYSSTTNQRASTNSAVSTGAGTEAEPQLVELDLTSSTGQINGVDVVAGAEIKVTLTRGTDTATGIAYLFADTAEVTFQ